MALLVLVLLCFIGCKEPPRGPESSTSHSEYQPIIGRISTGHGPALAWEDVLLETYPEPVWLTGIEVAVETKDGAPADASLADLVALGWTYPVEHGKRFYPDRKASSVVFRLSGTQKSVNLPPGYGIPMWSNEPLTLTVRWQNTSVYQKNTEVRLKSTVHFLRQRAAQDPMVPVIAGDLFLSAPLKEPGQFNVDRVWDQQSQVPNGIEDDNEPFADTQGRTYTEEWLVDKKAESVSFLLDGVAKDMPSTDSVFQTAYHYPATNSLAITNGKSRVEFSAGAASQGFSIEPDQEFVLEVAQDTGKAGQKNSARLLLYFLDSEFKQFPEMLQ
jgi:hypothetical protein